MITTTKKEDGGGIEQKRNVKKEMLKAKRELTETNNRIKEYANDEAKKIIDDLMRKNITLTVDLNPATEKITHLKNKDKDLVGRMKKIASSNSVAQSDIKDSEPYPTDTLLRQIMIDNKQKPTMMLILPRMMLTTMGVQLCSNLYRQNGPPATDEESTNGQQAYLPALQIHSWRSLAALHNRSILF